MKNRNPFNIHMKTTKKQWILVACELLLLIAGPMVLLLFTDNDLVMAIGFGVLLLSALGLCIAVVRIDRKAYHAEEKRLSEKQEYNQGFTALFDKVMETGYGEMTEQEKYFFLVYNLYLSSTLYTAGYFNRVTVGIPKEEIGKRFRNLPLSPDLRSYVEGVLLAGKDSMSIRRFSFELKELSYSCYDRHYRKDKTLGDPSYVYALDGACRYHVTECGKKKPEVTAEIYDDNRSEWVPYGKPRSFRTRENAVAFGDFLLKRYGQRYGDFFFTIREYPENEHRMDVILMAYHRKMLPEKERKFMDYYVSAYDKGNADFFENYRFDDYKDALKETLPAELYVLLSGAAGKGPDCRKEIKECDRYTREHHRHLNEVIYSFDFDEKLLAVNPDPVPEELRTPEAETEEEK